MTSRSLVRTSFAALAALLLVGATAAGVGCGQTAASCATVCNLPGADLNTCTTTCTAQQACGGADFQAYATCLGNAGTFTAAEGLCAAAAHAVAVDCGETTDSNQSNSDSLYSSDSTYSDSYDTYSGSYDTYSDSYDTYSSGSDSYYSDSYDTYSDSYDTYSDSYDSYYSDSYDSTGSSCFGDCCGDTCGDSIGGDSGGGSTECAVGVPCNAHTGCVLAGQGPCGSDEVLGCREGYYAVQAYPCSPSSPSCGYASGTCSESCTCTDGQMVCSGNCIGADAGISHP